MNGTVACMVLPAAALLCARSAAAETLHDVDYLTEHVLESGMDAHYIALPWPAGRLESGRPLFSVDLSTAHTETDFIDLDGPMVAVGAAARVRERWGYEALGFYSDMDVSGGTGHVPLSASFLNVPLDLPQIAELTNPRGTLRHFGAGGAAVYERGGARPSQIVGGLLLDRVDMTGFEIDYRLEGGADAGAAGVVDYSISATFLTPFLSWQQTRPLGSHWTWSPRAVLAWPVPGGPLDLRFTGAGFEESTAASGTPLRIGDPFAVIGLALTHARSGFEIDVGETALFPVFEQLSHPGVSQAWIVHVAWRQQGEAR